MMNRILRMLWAFLSGRALTPAVAGVSLLVYIGIAFFTDEALVTFVTLVRESRLFAAFLVLVPLNLAARFTGELHRAALHRKIRRVGRVSAPPAGFYAEDISARGEFHREKLLFLLATAGYISSLAGPGVTARRGFSAVPCRLLALLGGTCLVAGMLFSLTGREVYRTPLAEGEPLPLPIGIGKLAAIRLEDARGLVLSRSLAVDVFLGDDGNAGARRLGLYPPGRLNGWFVYPRLLGLAPLVIFRAPDFPAASPEFYKLMLYPPGREDSIDFPGTKYRLTLVLVPPEGGSDPFMTGDYLLRARLLRGGKLLFDERLRPGGIIERQGMSLAIPEIRRAVLADFVHDAGVPFIWGAALFLALAALSGIPACINPRREFLIVPEGETIRVWSLAEGQELRHASLLHEVLDLFCGRE